MPPYKATQLASPLFRLPAELRIAIYEQLDFPPVNNFQCRGIILSCSQAKYECEGVAIRMTKAWLAAVKKDILLQSHPGMRILLPMNTRTPSSMHAKFHTLRNLTLVYPVHLLHALSSNRSKLYDALRPSNAIFRLWLDSLTFHFRGPLKNCPRRVFRHLLVFLEAGFNYAHDPVRHFKENFNQIERCGCRPNVRCWQPEPTFTRRLVISWDLTKEGLRSEEMVGIEGFCQKVPTAECCGLRYHSAESEDRLLGEVSNEDDRRLRLKVCDYWIALRMPQICEFEKKCFKCGLCASNYRRYAWGLPSDGDERWL